MIVTMQLPLNLLPEIPHSRLTLEHACGSVLGVVLVLITMVSQQPEIQGLPLIVRHWTIPATPEFQCPL
jgi:hypothetical protein